MICNEQLHLCHFEGPKLLGLYLSVKFPSCHCLLHGPWPTLQQTLDSRACPQACENVAISKSAKFSNTLIFCP